MSSNEIQNVAFAYVGPANPTSLTGLGLWIAAYKGAFKDAGQSLPCGNGDLVYAATDFSGNGNHALQATSAARPTFTTNQVNGKPVFSFDGSDDFLSAVDSPTLSITGDLYIAAVVERLDTGYGWYATKGTGNNVVASYEFRANHNTEALLLNPSTTGTGSTIPVPGGFAYALVEVIRSGSTITYYVDGVSAGTDTADTRTAVSQPLYIGTRDDFFSFFNANIAEVVIAGSAPSGSTLTNLRTYFASTYGLNVAGTYTATFSGQTTGSLGYPGAASALQTALNGLSNLTPSGVTVTLQGNNSYNVEWNGTATAERSQPLLSVAASATLTPTVTRVQPGQAACVATVAVSGGGSVEITTLDRSGNPAFVATIPTDPAFTQNSTPVTPTGKYWGNTGSPHLHKIVYLFSQSFLVSDTIGVTATEGWATTTTGVLGLVAALAVPTAPNHVGDSTLGVAAVSNGTTKMGMNTVPSSGVDNTKMTRSNLAKLMSGWTPFGGTTFTTNSDGYVTVLSSGGSLTAALFQSGPTADSLGLPNTPDGTYHMRWTGPLMDLSSTHYAYVPSGSGGITTVDNIQLVSSSGGVNVISFDVAKVWSKYPNFLNVTVWAANALNLVVTRPGIDITTVPVNTGDDSPCAFDPDYVSSFKNISEIRFMDEMGVNDCSATDFTDLAQKSWLTLGNNGTAAYSQGNIISIQPYEVAPFTSGGGVTYLKFVSDGSGHGFTGDGQVMKLSQFDDPPMLDTGGHQIGPTQGYATAIHLLDSTSFLVPVDSNNLPLAATHTPSGTPWTAGCWSRFTNSPLDDMIDLANAVRAAFGTLTTVKYNIPHTMTAACQTAIFDRNDTRLDPELAVALTIDNEVWNIGNLQTGWYLNFAQKLYSLPSFRQAYARDNAALHGRARTAFAGSGRRLLCVYESQATGPTTDTSDLVTWLTANPGNPMDRLDIAPYFDLATGTVFEDSQATLIAGATDAQLDDILDAITPTISLGSVAYHQGILAGTAFANTPIGTYETGYHRCIPITYNLTDLRQSHVGIFSPRSDRRTRWIIKDFENQGCILLCWFEIGGSVENQNQEENCYPGWNIYNCQTMVAGPGKSNLTAPNTTAPMNLLQSVVGQTIINWGATGGHSTSETPFNVRLTTLPFQK